MCFEGSAHIGGRDLGTTQMALMGEGDEIEVTAGPDGARILILAARPIGEPVARAGPFVMNTRAEIEQAFADYQAGLFG
jgi:redox-sensitive bicupin YhaK (pirin superfamily)